jgi:uncharacterized caspase-like protein
VRRGPRDLRFPVAGDEGYGRPRPPRAQYGLVVGIDRYPALRDLTGACSDARAFHEWLVDAAGGGVPRTHTRLRLGEDLAVDRRHASPKKSDIDDDIDELVELARAAPTQPARLWLYFAGHGIAAGAGTASWLMADAKIRLFTNVSVGMYQRWLDRCRDFEEVVILSDCCRSLADDVDEAPQPHSRCRTPAHDLQLVFVAHATGLGHSAFEAPAADDLVRGHFTAALLEGLRGAAADPATGEVDAVRLAEHIRTGVERFSDGRQRAEVRFDDRLVLVAARRRDASGAAGR